MVSKQAASPEGRAETWRIMRNVVVISLAFMLQFTAYTGAANLQSSINAEAGLGTASLAAVYAGLILSNILLPAIVIKWIGCKWAIAVSFIAYMPYIAAQLHPRFWTLIPAGLLVGFGGGPLWCAKCTYLSAVSEKQHKISGVPVDALLPRFLGLFFMIFQLNQVWGNLISSLVLSSGGNEAAVTMLNASQVQEMCGASFLPSADAGQAFQQQPQEKIQTITGIYLACMAGASILVAVGVDSMKRYQESEKKPVPLSGLKMLGVTAQLMVEPNQLLLIIANIFIGWQQAFFGADFTASFVSCAVGAGAVGYVMLTYGAVNALGCVATGYIAKVTGRLPLLCGAAAGHTALFAVLLLWLPAAGDTTGLYIIAAAWGLCDSIWLVQMNAYYGTLFPGREEAAYANFRLWESVGYIVAYLVSSYLRTSVKTYMLLVSMYVGLVGYLTVEYRERSRRKVAKGKEELQGCDNKVFSEL